MYRGQSTSFPFISLTKIKNQISAVYKSHGRGVQRFRPRDLGTTRQCRQKWIRTLSVNSPIRADGHFQRLFQFWGFKDHLVHLYKHHRPQRSLALKFLCQPSLELGLPMYALFCGVHISSLPSLKFLHLWYAIVKIGSEGNRVPIAVFRQYSALKDKLILVYILPDMQPRCPWHWPSRASSAFLTESSSNIISSRADRLTVAVDQKSQPKRPADVGYDPSLHKYGIPDHRHAAAHNPDPTIHSIINGSVWRWL